jgi:hypothetical protein
MIVINFYIIHYLTIVFLENIIKQKEVPFKSTN